MAPFPAARARTALRVLAAAAVASLLVLPAVSADNGKAPATLSFFSGGGAAHADWFATDDQPPGDTDHQAIRIDTTTDPNGYAGVLVHHVTGIPAGAFPDSSFWVKTTNYTGPSLGSPRLVVAFQDALGDFVGYGDLRPLALTETWQKVDDVDAYPASGWDVMGGPCGFQYNVKWQNVQACFAGDTVLTVYITTDPYGVHHLVDDITVAGKTFSSASDNANGNNSTAGPDATTDPSLLPPLLLAATTG